VTCSHCQAENLDEAKFCRACGQLLAPPPASTIPCPHCQAPNAPGSRFCVGCGASMQPAAVVAAPPPAPAPAPVPADPVAPPVTPAVAHAGKRRLIVGVILLLVLGAAAAVYWKFGRDAAPESNTVSFDPAPAATPEPADPPAVVESADEPAAPAPAEDPVVTPETAPASEPAPAPEPAAAVVPEKKSKPIEKKPAKAERAVEPSRSRDEPGPPPRSAAAPAEAAPAPAAAPDWYAGLKAELRRCAEKDNFISRGLCGEHAKFRFCGDGNHWGEVPECVKAQETTNY